MMDDIKEFPKILVGKSLKKIGRCANLAWFIFGAEESFSIHVQCPWRLISNNNVLIASNDIYVPKDLTYSEDFNWDSIGATLFDKKAEKFNAEEKRVVKLVDINALGDILMLFDNIKLETFVDNSSREEQWRFFQKGGKHMVVRPSSIEWE